jgi:uncharacterized protein (TIGR03435 family)
MLLIPFCAGYAQPAEKPEFEVASIKPSPPPDGRGMRVSSNGGPGTKDPGLFTCENNSLSNLVGMAYNVAYYQLSGPDWLNNTRFDITARVPEGATKEQFSLMLQNLLADRFKLVVHQETRDLQKYELVVAKNGPKFKEAAEEAPKTDQTGDRPRASGRFTLGKDGFPVLPPGMQGSVHMNGRARMYQPRMTMEALAGLVSGQVAKPVTDATGLKGKYEISLYWASANGASPQPPPPPPPGGGPAPPAAISDVDSGPTIFQAIQDQLGLRLESKKGPVDFLVVDHMEKMPTEN